MLFLASLDHLQGFQAENFMQSVAASFQKGQPFGIFLDTSSIRLQNMSASLHDFYASFA